MRAGVAIASERQAAGASRCCPERRGVDAPGTLQTHEILFVIRVPPVRFDGEASAWGYKK